MFDIVPLRIEHLQEIIGEPMNAHLSAWFDAKSMAEQKDSVAGYVLGELMMVGGLVPYWNGRAHLWSIFSLRSRDHFVSVYRGIRRYLESSNYLRIEMDVPLDKDFTEVARRRAIALGFKLECERARFYRPNGNDSALYSWTKEP